MKNFRLALIILISTITLGSCVKKDFDSPPDLSGYDPHLPVNLTIAQLKKLNTGGSYKLIKNDSTIEGVVVGDDKSGNLYKQVVIQDSTGGISLLIDANNLYGDYPIGRKVYIKCKGLYLGSYHGLPQLGYAPDATGALTGIPPTLESQYIVKANFDLNQVKDTVMNITDLTTVNTALLNRLVTIDSMEFTSAYADGGIYAAPAPSTGTDAFIEDCGNNQIDVRSSGYANFAPYTLPAGRGRITAIYTCYGSTPQLVIRDTTDIKFYGARCPNSPLPTVITIDSLRKMFNAGITTVPSVKIKGVVISDADNGNVSSTTNLVLQNGNRGINVHLSGTHPYVVGDSVSMNIGGSTLQIYPAGTGALEVSTIQLTSAHLIASDVVVTPRIATIAQIIANYQDYEGTLVKVMNAYGNAGTYSTSGQALHDGSTSATIPIFTKFAATFANDSVATSPKTFTGIITTYNSFPEFELRNLNDVQ